MEANIGLIGTSSVRVLISPYILSFLWLFNKSSEYSMIINLNFSNF